MKIVYFVRHGESRSNVEKVYAGSRYDVPLTPKGIAQAEATATLLRGSRLDLIVSSPLLRAKTTAERIANGLGYSKQILLQPLLLERDFGAATGKDWESVIETQIDNSVIENMETIEQLAARMQQLLAWFRTVSAQHILAVGHGTAERMLRTIYTGRPGTSFLQTNELGNTEIREYLLD